MDQDKITKEVGNFDTTSTDIKHWFSTYGLITATRILGSYRIHLAQDRVLEILHNPGSVYHRLLELPLKNVLNGIILQQAADYQIYAQKLLIDYSLSDESTKDEAAPGATLRSQIEEERKLLIETTEAFNNVQLEHRTLIAESQAHYIQYVSTLQSALEAAIVAYRKILQASGFDVAKSLVRESMHHALSQENWDQYQSFQNGVALIDAMNKVLQLTLNESIKEKLFASLAQLATAASAFQPSTNKHLVANTEIASQLRGFRSRFYQSILQISDLIKLLPEYKPDEAQDRANKESLYFDKSLGDQ